MLNPASLQLQTTKRQRSNNTQARRAREITRRAGIALSNPDVTNDYEWPTTVTAMKVTEAFSGSISTNRLQFSGHSLTDWQDVPFLASDKAVYDRVVPLLVGLSATSEGIPLITLNTFTGTFTVNHFDVGSIKFYNHATLQTEYFDKAFYDAKTAGFPLLQGSSAITAVDNWPDIAVTAVPGATNEDLLAETSFVPYTYVLTRNSELLIQSSEYEQLGGLANTFATDTTYNRYFWADSRIHYTLPNQTGRIAVRAVKKPDPATGLYTINTNRPMFIHHPTAVMMVQATVTLVNVKYLRKLEICMYWLDKDGVRRDDVGGYPYVLGVYKSSDQNQLSGAWASYLHVRNLSVSAPPFLLPLHTIPTNNCYSLVVRIESEFKTISSGTCTIDCDVRIDSICY